MHTIISVININLNRLIIKMIQKPLCHIIFLGDSGTGKTSIINQYLDKTFSETSPYGILFREKTHQNGTKMILLDCGKINNQLDPLSPLGNLIALALLVLVFDMQNINSFHVIKD